MELKKENIFNNLKMFVCECGYRGFRWNDKTKCNKCGKEGRLEKIACKLPPPKGRGF